MKISRFFPVLLVLAPLSTIACAKTTRIEVAPDGGAPPAESVSATVPEGHDAESFCQALCDRQQECDNALDHQTCKNDCNNRQAAVFPKLRTDVVDLIVTCFAEKDCKSVLAGEVVGACAAESVASVAPSDAAVTYCNALDKAKKKCGTTTAKATCLEQAKLYDDDAIAEAKNCAARPCNEIDTCIGAAFGGFGTTNPTPPTSSTCTSSMFSDLGSCSSCAAGPCCDEAAACAGDSTCRDLMAVCSYAYGSTSTCSSYLQSTTTATRQLLGAYFQCASTSCGMDCSYVAQ